VYHASKTRSTPLGVIIIGILILISGIIQLLGGLALLGYGMFYWGMFPLPVQYHIVMGIVIVLWGILNIFAAFGLWALRAWVGCTLWL